MAHCCSCYPPQNLTGLCSSPLLARLYTSPGGVYHFREKPAWELLSFSPFLQEAAGSGAACGSDGHLGLAPRHQPGRCEVFFPAGPATTQSAPPCPLPVQAHPGETFRRESVITIHHCLITCRTRDSQLVSSPKEIWTGTSHDTPPHTLRLSPDTHPLLSGCMGAQTKWDFLTGSFPPGNGTRDLLVISRVF